jgi:hypothetical protein
LFGQSANVHSRFWLERPNADTVWIIFGSALAWGAWYIPVIWNATKLIVLMVAVKTVVNFRDVKGLALGISVVLPLVMSYLYSIFRTPIMLDRTLIFLSVPLLALLGSFLTIPGAKASTSSKILGALQVAAGVVVFTFLVYINIISWRMEQGVQSKDDFRAAASISAKFATEYSAVVFNNSASQAAFDYYFHRFDEGRKVDEYGVPCHYLEAPEGSSSMEPLVTPESIRALDTKLSSSRRVVLVRSNQHYSDPSGLLKGYFDTHWRSGEKFFVKRVEILIYYRD